MASSTDAQTHGPASVLFVCLGNICRSPMAEAVFRNVTHNLPSSAASGQKPDPRFGNIDSAGTGAYHALSPPDSRTTAVLKKHGIGDYEHAARKVRPQDFKEFHYLFAMDSENYEDLVDMRQRLARSKEFTEAELGQVHLFGSFGGKGQEEVVDPYYGGRDGFETAYEQMVRFSQGFLQHMKE